MAIATKPKNRRHGANQKRLYGEHQKRTKPFMKTYHPYLPLFMVLIVALAILGSLALGPMGAVFGVVGGTVGLVAIAL